MKRDSECPDCRGSGWSLVLRDGTEAVASCPRCRAEDRVGQLLRRASIPDRYRSKEFANYYPDNSSQKAARDISMNYVEVFPGVHRGLLFRGPCGVGKTHLAVAVLRLLVLAKQVSARFVDETELLRRLQYSYGPDSVETEREVLHPLRSADLLVWDDLGAGRKTEWVGETMRTILNHRYTRNKLTVFTTNLPLQPAVNRLDKSRVMDFVLEERVGVALYSRIMEMCRIVEIRGQDYRTGVYKPSMDVQQM